MCREVDSHGKTPEAFGATPILLLQHSVQGARVECKP